MTSARERGRQSARPRVDRLGRLGHVRGEQLVRRAARERRLPGEQLVRQHAERVDVGAVIDVRIGARLLGRHVRRRAERHAERR